MRNFSPAEIAARALGTSASRVQAVDEIKHGLTNRSWRVRADEADVVVRVSVADERMLRIDRRSEAAVLTAVAAAGVAPPLLLCDPDAGMLVTRYLGPPWSMEQVANERNLQRLGRLLGRLHAIPPPPGVRSVDLIETAEGYIATLERHGAAPELRSSSLRDRARASAALVGADGRVRLCHNDVHHLNLIDAGDLRLIDWEYAGVGAPLFDLASVCVNHSLSREQRCSLLAAYSNAVDAGVEARLDAAIWLFEYIRDLWTAVRPVA